MMRLLGKLSGFLLVSLLCVILHSVLCAGVAWEQSGGLYILRNEYVAISINPRTGGRIESLYLINPGIELIHAPPLSEAPQGSGLFLDRFWGPSGQIRDFERSSYKAEIDDGAPEYVSVALSAKNRGLRVEKTFTIFRGVGSVRADYEITNLSDESYTGRFWNVNSIFQEQAEEAEFFYPYARYLSSYEAGLSGEPGIRSILFSTGSGTEANHWINDPARPWAAVLSGGAGAAVTVDFPFLERFYSYHPPSGIPPTLEWLYIPIELNPLAEGEALAGVRPEMEDPMADYIFRTSSTVIPVYGMKKVSGAGEGIVASLDAGSDGVEVSFSSDRARVVDIVLSRMKIGGEEVPHNLVKKQFSLRPLEVSRFFIPASYPEEGTYVYSAAFLSAEDGREIAVFEAPYIHDSPSGEYVLLPEEEKSSLFAPSEDRVVLGSGLPGDFTRWAKPLAEPLKTVIIYPHRARHEVAELARRVDMEYELVEMRHPHVWTDRHMTVNPELASEKAFAGDIDLIILGGGVWWDVIPERFREKIMDRVGSGAGLVYVRPARIDGRLKDALMEDPIPACDFVSSGVPYSVLPGLSRHGSLEDAVKTYQYGEGTIIALAYNPQPAYAWKTVRAFTADIHDDFAYDYPYWEYYYSLVARAMLAASGRAPAVRVSGLSYDSVDGKLCLDLENPDGKEFSGELAIRLMDRRWEELMSFSKKFNLGEEPLHLCFRDQAEELSMGGEYFIDAFVTDQGRVVAWGSACFIVEDRAAITGVEFDKAFNLVGSSVSGKVLLDVPGENESSYVLKTALSDIHGRILAQKSESFVRASAGPVIKDFAYSLDSPPMSTLVWFNAEFYADGNLVDYRREALTYKLDESNDLTFTVWSVGSHHLCEYMAAQMKSIGIDWRTGGHIWTMSEDEVRLLARNSLSSGMEYVPMSVHNMRSRTLEGVVRVPCMTEPSYLQGMEADFEKYVRWASKYNPPAYFIADENSLGLYNSPHDFCQSPTCLQGFRMHLKEKYPSVDDLNRAWKKDFGCFSEARPYTFAEARDSGNFVPWIEHRVYMFSVIPDVLRKQKEIIERIDSSGRLAISGQAESGIYNAFDWEGVLASLDYVIAYARPALVDIIRSFRHEGSIAGFWQGYGQSRRAIRNKVWSEVLNGFFHHGYYASYGLLDNGDFSVTEAGEDLEKIISEIRGSGFARMLMDAEWVNSPVAIHYSIPSLVSSAYTGSSGYIGTSLFNENLNGWVLLLRDMGIQPPEFVSSSSLEEGLDPAKHPVFILPLSQALSRAEVSAVEDYVRAGGIIVADANPGILLENGARREDNRLAEIFGVEEFRLLPERGENPVSYSETGMLPVRTADVHVSFISGESLGSAAAQPQTAAVRFGGMRVGPGAGSGGQALSFSVNSYGRGRAVYLNALLSDYSEIQRRPREAAALVAAMRDVFARAGFSQEVAAMLPPGSQLVRYSDGSAQYIALWRSLGAPADFNSAEVYLRAKKHVYGVMPSGEHVFSDRISTTLFPGEVKIFALLPARRGALELLAERLDGEILYSVSSQEGEGSPGSSIMKLTVYRDGCEVLHHSRNIRIEEGVQKTIPLAVNERSGVWKLKATDIITGESYAKEISFGG